MELTLFYTHRPPYLEAILINALNKYSAKSVAKDSIDLIYIYSIGKPKRDLNLYRLLSTS